MIKHLAVSLCAALMGIGTLLSPALAARPQADVNLVGAGSTFDQPFFDKAFTEYSKSHGVTVNYQAIGSGAGIQQFTARTVDFGATDVPLDPTSELPAAVKAGGPVVQLPITLGGVAISYNIPGIKTGLHLTGAVLANIYLGLIKQWNDKQIKTLNPKVKLPALPIIVAHRSDGSGTSYIFTDYLSKVSDNWRGRIGVGKLPNWPAGVGGKGNEGVAAIVEQQPGSIGYIELAYVLQNHMKEAMLQNAAKKWTLPTLSSVAASAAKFPHVSADHFSIVNAKGAKSYPICGYSWVLLYKHPSDTVKGKALTALMKWMVAGGQKYAKSLSYAPLPKNVATLALKDLAGIK